MPPPYLRGDLLGIRLPVVTIDGYDFFRCVSKSGLVFFCLSSQFVVSMFRSFLTPLVQLLRAHSCAWQYHDRHAL
jgi:hypothetical protein